jgi:hypothetical protein
LPALVVVLGTGFALLVVEGAAEEVTITADVEDFDVTVVDVGEDVGACVVEPGAGNCSL